MVYGLWGIDAAKINHFFHSSKFWHKKVVANADEAGTILTDDACLIITHTYTNFN